MSVAGPSRRPPSGWFAQKPRIENTYEQDLLGLLDQLSLEERDEFQTSLRRRISAGGQVSDHDIALNDLIQQARALAAFEQDRILAERIATQEDSDVDEVEQPPTAQTAPVTPQSKNKRNKRKKKERQQLAQVDKSPVQTHDGIVQPNERTESAQVDGQQPRVVSAWAQRSPLRTNPTGKDSKGKGKEQSGAQVNGHGTTPIQWRAGDAPPFGRPFMIGYQSLSPPNEMKIDRHFVADLFRSSSTVSKPPVVNRPTGHDCVICQDPIRGAEILAPCGHYYDIGCVTDLFLSATKDESLFPPRCCKKNIPFAQVQPHLSQTLIKTFREKEKEFGTLKRVYCFSATCSRFLGPLSENDSASKAYACPAPGCGKRTCAKCREQHNGTRTHVCRPDAGATDVLELSRESGWSRCPGCSQMIELNIGCFHMTCRCRTEFCYLCRERWKTCSCRQWDEERLLAAAELRVDAQLGANRERDVRPAVPRHVDTAARNPFAILDEELEDPVEAEPVEEWPALAPVQTGGRTWSSILQRPVHPAPTTGRARTNTVTSASTSTPSSPSASEQAFRPELRLISQAMRERMIREMMEMLRVDHDCDHLQWRYQGGGGHCESCGCHLPVYLFRCRDCDMAICNRCRRNRL